MEKNTEENDCVRKKALREEENKRRIRKILHKIAGNERLIALVFAFTMNLPE